MDSDFLVQRKTDSGHFIQCSSRGQKLWCLAFPKHHYLEQDLSEKWRSHGKHIFAWFLQLLRPEAHPWLPGDLCTVELQCVFRASQELQKEFAIRIPVSFIVLKISLKMLPERQLLLS